MGSLIWRVEHLREVDSTNTYLLARADDDVDEGLVVYSDFQSAGRGRRDRVWSSPPRTSLLCSILLRPAVEAVDLQLVVVATALSVRAALVRLCGVRPDLKWPNDLIAGGKKLAGVLAELVTAPRRSAVVVGLGVNLTAHPMAVDATSVLAESGLTVAPRALLDLVLEELEGRRPLIDDAAGREELRTQYRTALATIGRRVRVEGIHDVAVGNARGVDDLGRLLVEVEGDVRAFAVGDVIHLRSEGEGSR